MIDCGNVVELYLDTIHRELHCTRLEDGRVLLETPYLHADGDIIEVLLEPAVGEQVRFTDEGITSARLETYGVDIRSRKAGKEAAAIARAYGVDLAGDTLQVQGPPSSASDMLIRLVGAIRGIDSLTALRREPAAPRFDAQLITFLNSQLEQVAERPQKAGRTGHIYRLTAAVQRHDEEVLVQSAAGATEDARQRSVEHALRVFFDINGQVPKRGKLVVVSSMDDQPWRSEDLQLLSEVAYVGSWSERDRVTSFLRGIEIPETPMLVHWQSSIPE